MPPCSGLATKLARLRESRGMSGRSFASTCGISREAVRKYESGRATPSNQTIFKIFSSLQLDPEKSKEAREIINALYYERINKLGPSERSYGIAANEELKNTLKKETDITDKKIDALIDVVFEQVGEERRTESLEHYIRRKILNVLED